MNITYVRDDTLEYRSTILDGLQKYNKKFTGKTESEIMNIYITDNNEIIGGCQTECEWNWVYIEALYYENRSVLKAILNELYKRYKSRVEGIFFESCLDEQIIEMTSTNFKILGTFEDKPKGFHSHVLVNQSMETSQQNRDYSIKIYHSESTYDKEFQVKVDKFNQLNHLNLDKEDLQYLAYEGNKIVGGVNGNLGQGYLYVSLLWVDESYRGKKIASKLMDLIEDEAISKGYHSFYLGTCTFQAKDFYEKRGYKVKMIVANCPKGYDDFTMVKHMFK